MLYATVSPVIAWRVHPTLSLAVGPTISYSDVNLESLYFKFRGDDVGFGFKAGLLWQPHPQWSFGASYQSATDLEYSGHSESQLLSRPRSSTTADAHFPQFVAAGVSFRPTTNWNFEFDVDWTDWDSLNQIFFQRADPTLPVLPFAFNYTSSFMYEFGVTRQLGKGWYVSTGYIYSENSSPDKDYNPLVNDDDLHLGSVGFGHRGQRWDWAFGYHFAYNGSREVTGSAVAGPFSPNGTYKTFNNAVNVAVTFKF
jgi:long-chain fatty acid transport protein